MFKIYFVLLCIFCVIVLCTIIGCFILIKYCNRYSNGVPLSSGKIRYYITQKTFEDFKQNFLLKNIYDIFDYNVLQLTENFIIIEINSVIKYAKKGGCVQYKFSHEKIKETSYIKKELLYYSFFPYIGIYDGFMDEFLLKKTGAKPTNI